tara:strand:- start:73 stop:1017 length:945 start_codon:yes stop_codon:yes gene_type:complete
MAKYRTQLPQLDGGTYLTDSGLETTLVFTDGLELKEFAAFELLNDTDGRERLYNYFARHAKIAKENKTGFILDSVTWRASSAWGIKLGYSEEDLEEINLKSIEILERVRNDFEGQSSKFVISGCLGPHGDGYKPTEKLSIQEAETYHTRQIETFSKSNADMVTAFTMTYSEEAIGIVRAAAYIGMPVVISFTVETDGKLPSGETLKQAIEAVDQATENAAAYFMLNCAHPVHFEHILLPDQPWASRLKGIRANASSKSHAELDESEVLDDGNPVELGRQYKNFMERLPDLKILGGCCGTDHRHIEEICMACVLE